MRDIDLRSVDLNLLPSLVALLEEAQVTRAAERAYLSQPAMSRALSRLRDLFEDDLLVRMNRGYRLTPRAERLKSQLTEIVPQLEALFSETFDPAKATLNFELLGSDYAVSLLGSATFRRLHERSPKSCLRFQSWHESAFDEVQAGTIDLAFYGGAIPAGLRSQHVLRDRFVCVVSSDHPLAGRKRVPLSQYLRYPHVVIDVHDGRQPAVDDPLEVAGSPREIGLTFPYHVAAPLTLPGTQMIATLPESLMRASPLAGVSLAAVPKEIPPMDYRMVWSPLFDRDPAHAWLRELVVSVAASSAEPPSP